MNKDKTKTNTSPVVDEDPLLEEWKIYSGAFAHKAAKLKHTSSRDTLRLEMETLLFNVSRTDNEKEKMKKRKRRKEQLEKENNLNDVICDSD